MYRIDNIPTKEREDAAGIKGTLHGMIAFLCMISASPAASAYIKDCEEKNTELEEMSESVEIGLSTCAWLTR